MTRVRFLDHIRAVLIEAVLAGAGRILRVRREALTTLRYKPSGRGNPGELVTLADERSDAATLSQAANYINAEFVGLTMHEARAAILEHLRQERVLYDVLMARALELARTGLADIQDGDTLHLQGASFLIDELAGEAEDRQRTFETLRALFRMIEEKHQLVQLLTRSIDARRPALKV